MVLGFFDSLAMILDIRKAGKFIITKTNLQ